MVRRSLVFLCLLCLILLAGCFFIKADKYNNDLAKIFPNRVGTKAQYFGLAEYAMKVTLKDIKEENNTKIYYMDGALYDAIGNDPNKRQFKVTYTVDENSIKEVVVNNDEFRTKGVDNRLNSIIPNQVILKLPLAINNEWNQKFTYNGKTYTAKTTIIDIKNLNNNRKQYVTRTSVNNISGFFKDEYLEQRTYEENKGLVGFSNTMPEYDLDVDRDYTQADFMFGYTQSTITYPD